MGICGKILFFFKFIIATVGCAGIGLTILIFSVPAISVRFFVQVLAKIFRPDLLGVLKPMHAILAVDRIFTHPGFNINIILHLDNDLDIKTATKVLEERLFPSNADNNEYEYEGLRKSLTSFGGYWFWKKIENFDIQDYVHLYEDSIWESDRSSAAPPIREEYNEDDLKEIASYLLTKPWRKNHGLWEIIILRNYRPSSAISAKKQTAFIIRCHHCLGDGYSLLRFIAVITNHDGEAAATTKYRRKHNIFYKVLLPIVLPVKALFDFTLHLADRQWDSNDWINRQKDPETTSFLSTWTDPIPVERIKNLKQKFGVSFLAVITEICGAAFRKMMIATGGKAPEKVSCVIPFPLPKHRGGLRIHTATALLKLHTGDMDVVERVYRSHGTILAEKGSTGPLVLLKAFNFGGYLPVAVLERMRLPGVTVGITPFPGMAASTYVTPEHLIRHSLFTTGLPLSQGAVGVITTLSHCGSIIFALTCMDHICNSRTQLDEFSRYVNEELQLLEEAYAVETKVLP